MPADNIVDLHTVWAVLAPDSKQLTMQAFMKIENGAQKEQKTEQAL